MKAYVFKSQGRTDHYAFTEDRLGGNLPASHGPWALHHDEGIDPSQPIVGAASAEVVAGIARDGYYVTIIGVRITRSGPQPFI